MRHLLLLLTLVSIPSLAADQWICLGDEIVSIVTTRTKVLGSESEENSDKFLVSEKGLTTVGSDADSFDRCTFIEGRPSRCEKDGGFESFFRMSKGNVFTILLVTPFEDETDIEEGADYILISGTCSPLPAKS